MRWEERGSGMPVVLLHGIPTFPALWRHVAPELDARVLAREMVGYGESIVTGLLLTNAISYDSWPIPSMKAMRTRARPRCGSRAGSGDGAPGESSGCRGAAFGRSAGTLLPLAVVGTLSGCGAWR